MKKRRIDRDIVVVLISTLLTLVAWVGFEVYRAYTRVQVPTDVQKYLGPLDPKLDLSALESLEKKRL